MGHIEMFSYRKFIDRELYLREKFKVHVSNIQGWVLKTVRTLRKINCINNLIRPNPYYSQTKKEIIQINTSKLRATLIQDEIELNAYYHDHEKQIRISIFFRCSSYLLMVGCCNALVSLTYVIVVFDELINGLWIFDLFWS